MKILSSALVVFALSGLVAAQQTGDANRDYTINGNGSLGTSYVATSVGTPQVMSNTFVTSSPGAPVIWAYANTGTQGWFQTASNSVDIGPGGLGFLIDGSGIFLPPGPWSLFSVTNGAGTFSINVTATSSLNGQNAYLAMAVITAASPDGFYVSQTHLVTFLNDPGACTLPGAIDLNLGDDQSFNQLLPFAFPYYGVVYNDLWVGSNGFVTFGGPNTDFTQTVGEFLLQQPRICEFWDDLTPLAGGGAGSVFFTTSAATQSWEVCFVGVAEFAIGGANTFRVKGTAGVLIEMGYSNSMSSTGALVGLSPGNNIDPVGFAINLNAGPNLIGPNQAPYEFFTGNFDLTSTLITFFTDGNGNPTAEQ